MNRNTLLALGILAITGGIACEPGLTQDDDNFREDVLYCENAVARVEECCHVTAASDVCRFHRLTRRSDCGCTQTGTRSHSESISPVLHVDESRALLDVSCDAVDCATLAGRIAKADAHESDSDTCTDDGSFEL